MSSRQWVQKQTDFLTKVSREKQGTQSSLYLLEAEHHLDVAVPDGWVVHTNS